MSIHLHAIQKAVLVPASVLALSLTLAAAPALAQPAATIFASDPADIGDCANGAGAGGAFGAAAGLAAGGPPGALVGGIAAGLVGCPLNVAIKLSKNSSAPPAAPAPAPKK